MSKIKEIVKTSFNLENTYASLPKVFFSKQNPSNVPSPKIVALNFPLIKSLGLNDDELKGQIGLDIFSGNKIPEGSSPIAEAYAGHQFGYFTMLGDGRAVLLGEHVTKEGKRFDIQLKGSGKTLYSRGGDGKAVLKPMLREYIISEAMHALGIKTTRSLAVVTTGELVMRDDFIPGAILTRVAKSHIRVGTFEYIANWGTIEDIKKLADYTLERHFKKDNINGNPYLFLLKEVIKNQAELISKWQLVGFIHGVMNTDNVSICGETIDYGPCAFMNVYDPKTVFSSIDTGGRYSYGNQPKMAAWNLARFAETLLPLLSDDEEEAISIANSEVSKFFKIYKENWLSGMRKKLGIFDEEVEDEALIQKLLDIMNRYKADYTNTFIDLTFDSIKNSELFKKEDFRSWYDLWKAKIKRQSKSEDDSINLMKNSNPAVIPRNHMVEEVLEAAEKNGDYGAFRKLLEVLSKPYAHSKDQEQYKELPKQSECRYKTYCGT